jgi:DNA-binding MarR family transcriptional regulator
MSSANTRYVKLPNCLQIDQLKIKYHDTLVYCAIKSFNNLTEGCFPAYETIAEQAGCHRDTVMASVERLENATLLSIIKKIKKVHYVNTYTFPPDLGFTRIPYEVFQADDLSFHEKAMLINIRQFFQDGGLTAFRTVSKMSKLSGITYGAMKKQVTALIEKGYITELPKGKKSKRVNCYQLTEKINWNYDYTKVSSKKKPTIKIRVS